jgi:hypothetical protein
MTRHTWVRATGKHRATVLVLWLCALAIAGPARAISVAPIWNHSWGDASIQQVADVAVDAATGRVAITGTFTGSVDFGGGLMTSAGGNDGFIATFEADGTFIAQRQFGDASGQFGTALAWASTGNLFVTGYFAGTVNMGGSSLVSLGSNDIVLARYDYRLGHFSSKKFGDASTQIATDLTIDDGDNVIITGYYQGTVNFGGSLFTSAGSYDMFLAKFTSGLAHTWSKSFGDAGGSQFGSGVSTDGAESVYLCGYYTGTVNFGGSTLTGLGSNDICVAKFNSAGTHQWSKTFGDANNNVAYRISASPAGDVYITGFFVGAVNFGGGALTSLGNEDMFLVKLSTAGSHLWSKRFGDASTQIGLAVAADNSAVYLTGDGIGDVDFGGGNQHAFGGREAYFAKFQPDGTWLWGRLFGDASDQYGTAVDVGAGYVALGGYFLGSMDFGLGALTASGIDAFLLVTSADAREPVIKSVRDVPNDQGRKVYVRFARSGDDDAVSPTPIVRYEAYVEDPEAGPGSKALNASPAGGGPRIYVGSIPAHGERTYEMVIPTFRDSTIVSGDWNSPVSIYAARLGTISAFSSSPITGSSIDNLAPGMSALSLSDHFLQWRNSTAPDVNYYSIYGASTPSFGSSTLIDYTIDTAIDLAASPRAYYFVTATDFSGNEGAPVMVRVLSGIDGTPTARVLSLSAYPNPFNPATTLRYTVPASGHVNVAVYDARGARVATLFDGERAAGAYSVKWDGHTEGASGAASGIYFARITQNGAVRTYKLVLLK